MNRIVHRLSSAVSNRTFFSFLSNLAFFLWFLRSCRATRAKPALAGAAAVAAAAGGGQQRHPAAGHGRLRVVADGPAEGRGAHQEGDARHDALRRRPQPVRPSRRRSRQTGTPAAIFLFGFVFNRFLFPFEFIV